MVELIELVKAAAPYVSPFIAPVIATFVKTKFEDQWKEYFQAGRQADSAVQQRLVARYLARKYKEHDQIINVAFNGEPQSLIPVYEPLTLTSTSDDADYCRVDRFPAKFLEIRQNILVMDTAGMGKSTLTKYLFVKCVDDSDDSKELMPVLVELRKLRTGDSITSIIAEQFDSIETKFDQKLLHTMIEKGGMLFLLDGYDEIPQDARETATSALRTFISQAGSPLSGRNYFVLSSREEPAISLLPGFYTYRINSLKKDEAFSLIRRYGSARGPKGIKVAEQLIEEMSSGTRMQSVASFLENPLLVSLLFFSFAITPSLPDRKSTFYGTVFEALFMRHDLEKLESFIREKKSGLEKDDFHAAMRALGFVSFKHGTEYDRSTLLKLIAEAQKKYVGRPFQPSDLLDDLVRAVPLFTREGEQYRWSHKSVQEYFVAEYICRDAKDTRAILLRMAGTEVRGQYENIFEFVYDLDKKAFRESIAYNIAKDFLTYWESSHSAIEQNVSKMVADFWRVACFAYRHYYVPSTSLNSVNFPSSENPFEDVTLLINRDSPSSESLILSVNPNPFSVLALKAKSESSILRVLQAKNDPVTKELITKLSHTQELISDVEGEKKFREQLENLYGNRNEVVYLNDIESGDKEIKNASHAILTLLRGPGRNRKRLPLLNFKACQELVSSIEASSDDEDVP